MPVEPHQFRVQQYVPNRNGPIATSTIRNPIIRPFEYELPPVLSSDMANPPAAAIPDWLKTDGSLLRQRLYYMIRVTFLPEPRKERLAPSQRSQYP